MALAVMLLLLALSLNGLPVSAAVRLMEDGTIFDPEWFASRYPDAGSDGTDTDSVYRYYQLYGQGKGEKPYDEQSVSVVVLDQLKKASARAQQAQASGYGIYAPAWKSITSTIYDTDEVKVWHSEYAISSSAESKLAEAIAQYEEDGYTVGFVLVDLKTGDAVSCHAGSEIYSASVIKAPYIFSLLESGTEPTHDMYLAGNQSDNDAYRRLRTQYGNDIFVKWLQGTNVPENQGKTRYIYTTPLDLCRMFYRGTNLILGEEAQSDWARETFTDSLNSAAAMTIGSTAAQEEQADLSASEAESEKENPSGDAMTAGTAASSAKAVYSKAGWIATGGGSKQNCYTNAAFVDGDNPYIVAVMSDTPGYKGLEYTKVLMPVLDEIHEEMVNPVKAVGAGADSLEKFAGKAKASVSSASNIPKT